LRVFIDSNVPMYVAGREHPLRAPSHAFLEKVRSGEIDACTSTEVLQEILYRYAALDRLDLGLGVYRLFVELCPLVLPVTLADTDRAQELLERTSGISVRDAVHAAIMINHDIATIASHDRGFDRVAGIRRFDFGALET
jgi:uncharacterized protein